MFRTTDPHPVMAVIGLQVTPGGRTARLIEVEGALVAQSETVVTDDVVFDLIESSRK